jgi:hypothetical protein
VDGLVRQGDLLVTRIVPRIVAVTAVELLDLLNSDAEAADAAGQHSHADLLRSLRTSVADAPPTMRSFTYATHTGEIRECELVTAVDADAISHARGALERLCKWRSLFAGWQLGTRPGDDPESQAVRDHREATILLRAELSALTRLLVEAGVFTAAEFSVAVGNEAEELNASYEERFPGVTATANGLSFDTEKAWPWMSRWKP